MTTLYAVVRPAVYKKQARTWFDTITSIVVHPFYVFQFETVCGYTLGHQPLFYQSLDDAKSNFSPTVVASHTFFPDRARQNAIIEMTIDNSTIVEFTILHTVSSIYEQLIPQPLDGDEEIIINLKKTIVEWRETDIEPMDVSIGALKVMTQYYQQQQQQDVSVASVSL